MKEALIVQGRKLEAVDIERIRQFLVENPTWSRRRLSEALAAEWDWRNGCGRLKDMAARSLLVKLHERGYVELPPRRQAPTNRMRGRQPIAAREWDTTPLTGTLPSVGPLTIREISTDDTAREECTAALAQFHYLGWVGAVGENLAYAVRNEAGRLLSSIVFGSAAWKCAARDAFIGWTTEQQQQHLHRITNNTRFLILPFVRIPHLASWGYGVKYYGGCLEIGTPSMAIPSCWSKRLSIASVLRGPAIKRPTGFGREKQQGAAGRIAHTHCVYRSKMFTFIRSIGDSARSCAGERQ